MTRSTIKKSEDTLLSNEQMREVYKTLPKAILAGVGGGLTLRAIQAALRRESLIQRGAERDYGKLIEGNPALTANRERKLRIPAIEPAEELQRQELPPEIALRADVLDPEDVRSLQKESSSNYVPLWKVASKEQRERCLTPPEVPTEYVPLCKIAAKKKPSDKVYSTDLATALVSGRSQGRGVLGTVTDAFVPTELKPRLQREWIDATNPVGTFFRGTREYSLDESGNPVPGDYVKGQKAWQIPASYPAWALTAGVSGLAAFHALNKYLGNKKQRRLQDELDDARAQFEAALAYEADQAKQRGFKRAGYSDLLDSCAEFHEELDRFEQLYERLNNDNVVKKCASFTKAYLGGISSLSALMGLMAAHRAYKHSKRRREQEAAYDLLSGDESPSAVLKGFGERLLDRRFRSGYGFELSDTDPVSADDTNIQPYAPLKDLPTKKKKADVLSGTKTGSLYKAAESLAFSKFAAATWMLRGINPAYANQSNKALGTLFKGMKRPVKKTFNIDFNPKVLSTPDAAQAASNVNNLLQETPIRHSGALLNAMQNKDPDKVQRFLDMRRRAEEHNNQWYHREDILRRIHRNNMREPNGRLRQVRQREPQQSTLFTPNDTPIDSHNRNFLSLPSVVPTERKWVFAGNEGSSAASALSPQVIARKALQGKPILSHSYYKNKDDLFLSNREQGAKRYLARYPEVWKPIDLSVELERKAVEDWLRKNYPAAFTRGRGQPFQPYYDEPVSKVDPSVAGLQFGNGNRPRLLRRQEDLTEFRKQKYKSLRKWRPFTSKEKINAMVEAAVRDKRIANEAHSGLHEGGHSANDSGVRGEALRKAYYGDPRTGADEILADNMSKVNLPKIFDQPRGSEWAKEVEGQTTWYQKYNIDKFLSGDTQAACKVLKDLRGVPGTGENLGKLVHPVTGDVLDLSPEVRKLIELRIREIER